MVGVFGSCDSGVWYVVVKLGVDEGVDVEGGSGWGILCDDVGALLVVSSRERLVLHVGHNYIAFSHILKFSSHSWYTF